MSIQVLDFPFKELDLSFADAESYFRGERVQWGPVIVDMFDAVMLVLQRLIIDLKGIAPLEDLRRRSSTLTVWLTS